jgi:AcrR family transcriptional regulator
MTKRERGPYAKSIEVRRSILEACTSAFGESGFHGVSMAEIARRAGISHTGLLHHFPTKEVLLTAVLTMQDARTEQFLAIHAELDGTDPIVVIRGMLEAVVGREHSVGLVEAAVTLSAEATAPNHPAHAHFLQRYAAIRRFLARQFRELDDEGRLRTSLSPEQLAAVTVALSDGLQTQWLYDSDAVDVDVAMHGALAAFIPELT